MIGAVRDALAGHLSGVWTGDVAWSGRAYSSRADTPYVAATMPALTRRAIGLGRNAPRQWQGAWQLVAATPFSAGERAALDLAWAIAGHYARGTAFPSLPGLTITNADVRPPYQDTDFNRVPVVVEWFLMETS